MEEEEIDVTIKFRKNKIAHAGDTLLIIIPKAFKQDFLEIGVNRPFDITVKPLPKPHQID